MGILYADLAFVLNAAMDYLALCCTALLTGGPIRRRRLLGASALGALYATVVMVCSLRGTVSAPVTAGGMVWLAFGPGRRFWRCYLLFLAVSCALAGMAEGLCRVWMHAASPWSVFAAVGAAAWVCLGVIFRGDASFERHRVRAAFENGGRRIHLTLLWDSGNLLRDPMTGQILCIVRKDALEPLLQGREEPLYTAAYETLGQKEGKLPYFYCDSVTVGGTTYRRYPVGLAEEDFAVGAGAVGLWGGEGKEKG